MSEGPSVVADNGRIYCFHQGTGDNGQLWYNVLNGGTWAGDAQVPNTGMSKSPSAVVFNGQIFCFHQGSGENGQLWYNILDLNRGWLGDTQLPNTGMSKSPGAVVFNGQLSIAFIRGRIKTASSGTIFLTATPRRAMSTPPTRC
jgi:hypothetical protein